MPDFVRERVGCRRWPCWAAPGSRVMPETSLEAGTICCRVDTRVAGEHVLACAPPPSRFSSSDALPGALAQAVDRATRPGRAPFITAASEIGDGQGRESFMAMDPTQTALSEFRDALPQLADQSAEMFRQGITDGIRHVDRGGARRNHLLEECGTGSPGPSGRRLPGKIRRCWCIRAPISPNARPAQSPATAPLRSFLFHMDGAGSR